MKIKSLLVLIFLSSLNIYAFEFGETIPLFKKRTQAKDCSTVDLRGADLGPVRDQDTVGWCFAFAASDLVSYRIKKRVSAVDMSITFYKKMKEMPRDAILSATSGGEAMGAFSQTNSEGYCLESDLPSEDYVFPKNCGYAGSELIFEILQSIEKLRNNHEIIANSCQLGGIPSVFKNLNFEVIKKTMMSEGRTSFEVITDLQEKNCKNRFKPSTKISMRGGLRSGFDTLKDIDDQLNKSNPVAYNYDANFLLKKKVSGIANHYSSLIGRRFDSKKNSCQYLLRNSWGRNCTQYPAPYESQCEEGNIWVDEETIGKSVIGVHFLN